MRGAGRNVALSEVWAKGGAGGEELAEEVVRLCDTESHMEFAYDTECSIKEKIEAIARKIYGADGVDYAPKAEREIRTLESIGLGNLPICMAKNQYSLTDDAKKSWKAGGLPDYNPGYHCLCRSRLPGRSYRRYYENAGASEGARSRED